MGRPNGQARNERSGAVVVVHRSNLQAPFLRLDNIQKTSTNVCSARWGVPLGMPLDLWMSVWCTLYVSACVDMNHLEPTSDALQALSHPFFTVAPDCDTLVPLGGMHGEVAYWGAVTAHGCTLMYYSLT